MFPQEFVDFFLAHKKSLRRNIPLRKYLKLVERMAKVVTLLLGSLLVDLLLFSYLPCIPVGSCGSESTENYVMDLVIGTIGLCAGLMWMFGRNR